MGLPCKFEKEIIENEKGIARIEVQIDNLTKDLSGAFKKISAHVESGRGWRMAIFSTVFIVFVQIVVIAYYAGKVVKIVEIFESHVQTVQACEVKGGSK